MEEDTRRLLDTAEESFRDTINEDISLVRDTSSYITWITALATGAIAIAISQAQNLISDDSTEQVYLAAANLSLFLSITIGMFGRYQAQRSIKNLKVMAQIAVRQRLYFYLHDLTDDPLTFERRYSNCEYISVKHHDGFHEAKQNNHRFYREENSLAAQLVLFAIGYIILGGLSMI